MLLLDNKGDIMDVSSTSTTASTGLQADVMKKAQDVQEQQVTKLLEGATEQSQKQSQQVTAQKTGMGSSLNLLG